MPHWPTVLRQPTFRKTRRVLSGRNNAQHSSHQRPDQHVFYVFYLFTSLPIRVIRISDDIFVFSEIIQTGQLGTIRYNTLHISANRKNFERITSPPPVHEKNLVIRILNKLI